MSTKGADARARIAARIRALLAKTVENGCTEAEALSAAVLAADLLARHEMDLDETEVRATPFDERAHVEPDAVGERLWRPASAIAELTHCRWWRTGPGIDPVRITFLGHDHEVEIAGYLLAICARAMRSELDDHIRRRLALIVAPGVRRRRCNGFLDGMAQTLCERIRAMVPAPPPAEARGLVVLRKELVDAELARRGIDLEDMRARSGRDWEEDYAPGRAAGERVALDPGLAGPDSGRARIGRHGA